MSLQQEILDLAFSLHGEQEPLLEKLCPAAEQMLTAQLREGITPLDCHDCFLTAAALLALSMLEGLGNGGLESMDVGTLSLRFSAEPTRLHALANGLLSPWMRDGFAFLGVRA